MKATNNTTAMNNVNTYFQNPEVSAAEQLAPLPAEIIIEGAQTPRISPENVQTVECTAESEKTAQGANDAEYKAELLRRVKTAVELGAIASDTTGAKIVKIHAALTSHYIFDFGEGTIIAELSNGLFLKYNIREYKCPAYILNPRESQTLGYMLFAAPKYPDSRKSNHENRTYKTLRGCLKYYGMEELPEAEKITFDAQTAAERIADVQKQLADFKEQHPQAIGAWSKEAQAECIDIILQDPIFDDITPTDGENEPKAERMKSYSDIERQVGRILAVYLVDDRSQPLSPRHHEIVLKVRRIQRRYTYNINRAEGFMQDMTFEEAESHDFGGIYYVYKDRSKHYPRAAYMGATAN